jgi:hypothetical protein
MELICPTCEKPFNYKGGKVHFEINKNHFCSRKCQNIVHGKSRRKFRGTDIDMYIQYTMYLGAKKRAKKNGIHFTIELDDVPEIPIVCPILGIPIKKEVKSKTHGPKDNSPSLDRIINELGYVKGNIRIISNRVNRIKSNSTPEEIYLLHKDNQNKGLI